MDNLLNKDITKDDICFDYIVNILITKHNYKLIVCDRQSELIKTHLVKTVLKYGDLYVICFEDTEEDQFIKHLLSPMIEPLCRGDYVDKDYPLTSFISSEVTFFVGFSHVNICKVISFITTSRNYTFNCPNIELVCAMKPLSHRIKDLNKDTIKEVKISLGLLLLFKCIQYFKEKNEKKIILECNYNLINYYYYNLFFEIGVSDKFKYKINSKPVNTGYNIVLLDDERIGDDTSLSKYRAYDYYDEKEKYIHKAIEKTLFKMYLDIDKKYNKVERHIERRIEYLYKAYYIKDLFDSSKPILSDSPFYNRLVQYNEFDD
uniref:Uncharacterized protein n=1 Tax=viral metagenome TaxID=1070528 RepID=A0A6C0DM94_9ZZZZ